MTILSTWKQFCKMTLLKRTKLFRENPFNPILRTEKLHPKEHDVGSFFIYK
jgi:hypothetical protein